MEDDNLAAAQRLYDAPEADDMPAVLALCAPDAFPGEPELPYAGRWLGHDEILRWADAHDEAEEILDFRVDTGVAGDDLVFVLGHFKGRAKPTGAVWETNFVHALTFREGRITRFEAFFDTAGRRTRPYALGVRRRLPLFVVAAQLGRKDIRGPARRVSAWVTGG